MKLLSSRPDILTSNWKQELSGGIFKITVPRLQFRLTELNSQMCFKCSAGDSKVYPGLRALLHSIANWSVSQHVIAKQCDKSSQQKLGHGPLPVERKPRTLVSSSEWLL